MIGLGKFGKIEKRDFDGNSGESGDFCESGDSGNFCESGDSGVFL